jgi:zinc protease
MKTKIQLLACCAAVGLLSCASQKTPAPKAEPVAAPAAPPDPRYQALPTPTATRPFVPPPVNQGKLTSGATLWHAPVGDLPLVSVHLIFPVGSSTDPAGKEGLTLLSADMLDEGAGPRSALGLSDELGRLATDYSASAGVDYVLLSMATLEDTFDESLALLADIVRKPTLSKDEFERRRAQHVATATAALSDPNSRVSVGMHHVLFGDGYAGLPPAGLKRSLEAIQIADVKAHVRKLTVPDGAHFVVVGKIDEAEARAAIERHFSGWKGKRVPSTRPAGKSLPGGQVYFMDFPGAAQSALAVAMPAGGAADPNFFRELVMNERIGGAFTGRINMNLREDKGYTYGAFGAFRRYRQAGYYAVMSSVVSEATTASVHEILRELGDLCQARPLSAAEHQEAVAGLLLGYPREFATVDTLGVKVASLPIYDRPADYLTTWPTKVEAISLSDARAAAAPYCDAKSYRIVIAGDRQKLSPSFAKQGMTVVALDQDGRPLP